MNGIGNNLKRARLFKNLSLAQAGKLLNMSATAISKYEKGLIVPDSTKLIEFANAYEVKSIDLIGERKLPEMKFDSFRKKKKLTGKKLELLKDVIQNAVANYLDVLNLNKMGGIEVKLQHYNCSNLTDAEVAAEKYREYIKISNIQPISDLISILENLGIAIIQIKNKNNMFNDFDGLSEVVGGIPFIVLLDDITDGARQRFTIAHELGHLVLNINDSEIDSEKLCNRFASSLLMPKETVVNEFGSFRKRISMFELKAYKEEYKVSCAAIVYRLKDLDIISDYLYKNLYINVNKIIGKVDKDPIEPEISNQFKRLVHKLESSEIISVSRACELLGVTIHEYNSENNNY